jgi:hypothetical protein
MRQQALDHITIDDEGRQVVEGSVGLDDFSFAAGLVLGGVSGFVVALMLVGMVLLLWR